MRCIIVDDDETVRIEVEQMVKRTPFLQLQASCSNALEAFNVISYVNPDLIFLDVMMPEMTGLDLLNALKESSPQVILMTLNKHYAVDGFNYDVTDFLTKPISEERFQKAVLKAKMLYDQKTENTKSTEHIFVKDGSKLVKIKTEDILYLESQKDVLLIQTTDKQYSVISTLKAMLDKLPSKSFVRVHNSFAVRLNKINSIEDSTISIGNKLIPIGGQYKQNFLKELNMV